MRHLITFTLFLITQVSFTQVYNFGANEIAFKNLVKNGITYVKTGDTFMDSVMLACLDEYWTLTDYAVVDQYKKPQKSSTALFITTKEMTRKHMMDRKNQHVLVLQPASIYMPRKEVKMEETLGYMYLNGFYDLVSEKEEYRFAYMLVQALNRGLTLIKNDRITGDPGELNEKIAEKIIKNEGTPTGYTLILNREQTRHAVVAEQLTKLGIEHRLLGEEEYYETLQKKDPSHVILYFAVNRFSDMALVRLKDGRAFYSKHFREPGYRTIDKKVLKTIAPYFY